MSRLTREQTDGQGRELVRRHLRRGVGALGQKSRLSDAGKDERDQRTSSVARIRRTGPRDSRRETLESNELGTT